VAQSKPLLIVDGDALAHRAYYALGSVTAPDGRPIGLLQGTIAMLAGAWDAFAPRAIAFAVDSREESERHALVPAYQAQRVGEADDDLIDQLDALPALVRAFGIPAICVPPWEADDVCATLATLEEAAGGTALVLTHDRDAYQLASARTTIIRPVSGVSEVEHVDPDGVVERYGVRPDQVPDLISLRGDPSDNIPGARGIGAKTAAELLQRFNDLEGVIANADTLTPARSRAVTEAANELRAFRTIATMQRALPIELPPTAAPDWAAGAAACAAAGMARLAERLRERA
jgi:DNA polymerase I